MTDTPQPALNQVALAVIDLERTEAWFREGLGFIPAGGSRLLMSTPIASKVMGMPKVASTCWWLIGRNSWFQLEMFQFSRPKSRLLPAGFRVSDVGYTRMGVHVVDFEATLQRLARLDSLPLAPVTGGKGARRACLRSPDGVYVEILEADPLPQAAASSRSSAPAVRFVTLSTPDLKASLAYLATICGREPVETRLHVDADEGLWGLSGSRCRRAMFECGDVLLEVVEYLEPRGCPWPRDYRICDQGILNIAFGTRNRAEHGRIIQRALAFGARPNHAPIYLPGAGMVYVNDALGFSVEIVWVAPRNTLGFVPAAMHKRPRPCNQLICASVEIASPTDAVWAVISDPRSLGRWNGFGAVELMDAGAGDGDTAGRRLRYRLDGESPFSYYLGEFVVIGAGPLTTVTWTIRYRRRNPLLRGFMRRRLQRRLRATLEQALKPGARSAV